MKILYIITRSDVIGGASIHLLDLAKSMQERGHTVLVFYGKTGIFEDHLKEYELQGMSINTLVRNINFYKDIKAYFNIKNKVKLFQPDLIHLHSSKAGVIGRLVSNSLNIPCIFTAHGWSFTDGVSNVKKYFYRFVEKKMATYASKIITVSEYDKKLALQANICEESSIIPIHNGVKDFGLMNKKNQANLRSRAELIMVARFDNQKNHALLIDSLAKIKSLDFKLTLVGDGPLMSKIKEQVAACDLINKVEFLGSRNDIGMLLSKSDIFILTSNWEGFPLTILEAMSMSLPVVASNVGGVAEILSNDVCGYLIDRNDIKTLTASIKNLINSSSLRQKMGQRARRVYVDNFSLSTMVDKTELVYLEVADKL